MKPRRHRGRAVAVGLGSVLAEAIVVGRRRGSLLRAATVVRCRRGHLFTTIWIPGVSVKSLRLGVWRLQRCPVGRHWSIVTPVRTASLTDRERRLASGRRDIRLP